jgi:hypothetical protein
MKMRRLFSFRRRPFALLLTLAVLFLLLLGACQAPAFLQSELPDDGPPVATSSAAAGRFGQKVAAAGERAVDTQQFTLTVTQEEVTSFLNLGSQLAEQLQTAYGVDSLQELQALQGQQGRQAMEGLPDWAKQLQGGENSLGLDLPDLSFRVAIKEPEVHFKGNGQIIVRGYGQVLSQRQALRLVLAPRASQGELVLDFVEGKLGPVPVPEGVVDLVGKGLASLILTGRDYVEISRIQVSSGSLTLTGRYIGNPLVP